MSASEGSRLPTVVLDGETLTPRAVAAIARGRAPVALAPAARARNEAAEGTAAALVAAGVELYGASTGVGALSARALDEAERADYSLRLLRSHASGGGPALRRDAVRAAMAVRANQLGAGGAGVAPPLHEALVRALNAGLEPVVHTFGSLGTGDLTALAEIALGLLGEGGCDADALRGAGIGPIALGPRDGLAFMSSNAAGAGASALVAVDAAGLLDAWLAVAALSLEAAGADPVVFDARAHPAGRSAGAVSVAGRMRAHLDGARAGGGRVQYAYPFRIVSQIDGATHDALHRLERAVTAEINLAGENALIVAPDGVALPNGAFAAAALAGALDGLRLALAQSASLIGARVSALLDPALSGLPAFLARDPGPDSGAMMLEYTAAEAAAEVRSLALPVAVQSVSVARGVESHATLASVAARRAQEALAALRVLVAAELVVAVRALRLAGREPAGAGSRSLFRDAAAVLDAELRDRPLHGDLRAAAELIDRHAHPARA